MCCALSSSCQAFYSLDVMLVIEYVGGVFIQLVMSCNFAMNCWLKCTELCDSLQRLKIDSAGALPSSNFFKLSPRRIVG